MVIERPHCLSFQVYTYLARWVVRDIHEERTDTKARLYSQWVDQLAEWRSQERQRQAILTAVGVVYMLATVGLLVLALAWQVAVSWPVPVVLATGLIGSSLLIRSSKVRQQRIEEIRVATREMLETETDEGGVQRLVAIAEETTCPKLKKYLEHHDRNRLYICQARGVIEYHQANTLGDARG